MSFEQRLQSDYQTALRARDQVRVGTLRMLRAALQEAAIAKRGALDEAGFVQVVGKQVKQRRESAEAYRQAGRGDLAEREETELAILEAYLPAALTPEALRALVAEAIGEAGATAPEHLGAVMRVLMPRVQGRADGREVNALVRELLSG